MLNKIGFNNEESEKLKRIEFNLRLYLEKELGLNIKSETLSSESDYLNLILEEIDIKNAKIKKALLELTSNQSKTNIDKKYEEKRMYQKLKKIMSEHNRLSSILKNQDSEVEDNIRYIISVKKKVDKLNEEKERIKSEIFLLDIVKDMKLNDGICTKCDKFEDKLKITDNIKEIENHITLYEKDLLESFYIFKRSIEEDYREVLKREMGSSKYAQKLINYFFEVDMEIYVFEIVTFHHILPLKFQDIPSTYNKSNLDNIKIIMENFFLLVENFYKNLKLMDDDILYFFNEDMFFKFTNYFFEDYLCKYFKIILGKNLEEKKDQFFLDYLEKIHFIFNDFTKNFNDCKEYSIYFHELIINNKNGVLEKYYEEYFTIEEKFFNYRTNIYINILKDKLTPLFEKASNKKPFSFKKLLKVLNNEKMEEYLEFIKKSIYRCHYLSRSSSSFFQINKLVRCSLKEFEDFINYILTNFIQSIPNSAKNTIYVDSAIFRSIEFLFVFLVRMNINQKNYISLIKGSNYFAETDEYRKTILENIKVKIISLNEKVVQNIINCTLAKFVAQKRSKKTEIAIFGNILELSNDFINEIKDLTNIEIKNNIEVLFYKKFIDLIESLFFKYYQKYKRKIVFHNEFKLFFECFNSIKEPELESNIVAFKYFLLCLKSEDKDIQKFVENTSKERVNFNKIEIYKKFLNEV